MMDFSSKLWVRILLFNLAIVAAMGVLMRYKIGFEFPFFDQQNIQHAHSHFAFTGWVAQALFVLIISLGHTQLTPAQLKRYNLYLWANLICSYGMFISFFLGGYGPFSITFSTLSIALVILFSWQFFHNSAQFSKYGQAVVWIRGALIFAVLSSVGTAFLAYMMISKNLHQNWYLASVYFYLHFQYNGWFFFGCVALFIGQANNQGLFIKMGSLAFHLLFWSCIPAYFLSILWAHIPIWVYILVVIASVAQLVGWLLLLKNAFTYVKSLLNIPWICRFLLYFISIAGTIKFLMQCVSTIPAVSHLAYGFRPIIIAYLHLVLLALISIMLILYMYSLNLIKNTRWCAYAIFCFALGVLFNEIMLAIQGVASIGYIIVPYTNEILLIISLFMLISLFSLLAGQIRKDSRT